VTFSAGAGAAPVDVACAGGTSRAALLTLIAGLAAPARGELTVFGQDMNTARGRAEIRRRAVLIPPPGRPAGFTVRGLVLHAAWLRRLPARSARCGQALDRLNLAGWASCPMTAVPDEVARRAWLAACTVHEPDLLLVDGLLDNVTAEDAVALAGWLRALSAGTALLITGRDATRIALCGAPPLTLTDGGAHDG
jgi:ABC-type multidrug transport system ATPase subunit